MVIIPKKGSCLQLGELRLGRNQEWPEIVATGSFIHLEARLKREGPPSLESLQREGPRGVLVAGWTARRKKNQGERGMKSEESGSALKALFSVPLFPGPYLIHILNCRGMKLGSGKKPVEKKKEPRLINKRGHRGQRTDVTKKTFIVTKLIPMGIKRRTSSAESEEKRKLVQKGETAVGSNPTLALSDQSPNNENERGNSADEREEGKKSAREEIEEIPRRSQGAVSGITMKGRGTCSANGKQEGLDRRTQGCWPNRKRTTSMHVFLQGS